MRQRKPAFVNSGAWTALALSRGPRHEQAREQWELFKLGTIRIHPRKRRDREQSWNKLLPGDATSFTIMKRARIRLAFTFDRHFSVVGFRFVA